MSLRAKVTLPCVLLAALALLVPAGSAAARPLVAKDGKIHACYKFRGKHKGALRLVHGPRVRCQKKWRKVAWYVHPPIGPQGAPGPQGVSGPQGAPGLVDPAALEALESRVTELLSRVESLETVVGLLCVQTEALLPSFSCPAL